MASTSLVDAIYIASPNALHASQSILCMEHGKHVLCEKPLASNAREAREMAVAARHNGCLLMEAMKSTLTPNFRIVREYLPRIGTPRRWFAAFGKYSSRYDSLKAGELPNAFNPELAGGAAMDIGVYSIYPMVALFGKPQRVQATVVKLPSGVDGHGAVNYQYPDGMIATTLHSKIVDMALPWEIEGEDGTIRGDAINSIMKLEFRERGGQWQDITSGEHCGNDYLYEISHFIDLVEGGFTESPVNTHECSISVLEIVDEIRRQGGVVYPNDQFTRERV